MRRILVVAGLLASWSLAAAREPEAPPVDPWVGKLRADVVALLGEPDKSKAIPGGTILTYRLVRLDETAPLPPGVRVLDVPGVGVVGRLAAAGPPPAGGIEPTETDRRGRPTDTIESDESYSVTWSSKTRELERTGGEERPATRGKLKLTFELNSEGAVATWSRSPRK